MFMSNKKPPLYGLLVTLVTIIFPSCTALICPTSILLQMTCNHTGHNQMWLHHTVPFMFCNMASCHRFISTLVTYILDSFMNWQFVFWYTGSLRSFVVALVPVISNLFMHGQFMMKKTRPCLEIYAALVTHKFKPLMSTSHCGNPASR